MSPRVEHILAKIHDLSAENALELTYAMLDTLEEADLERADEMWCAEMERRVDDMRSGRVQGIPAEEVMERLRKELP